MIQFKRVQMLAAMTVLCLFFVTGCGYTLKYGLNKREISRPQVTAPMKVAVAVFTDERAPIEREVSARKEQNFKHTRDYTYDREFKGDVPEEVSKMLVKHLRYAGIFSEVRLSRHNADEITPDVLAGLAKEDVDAVLAGEIEHMYGFAKENTGRVLLYSLGLGLGLGVPIMVSTADEFGQPSLGGRLAVSALTSLGLLLDGLHKRDIERHTQLRVRLISTQTGQVIWQDTVESYEKAHRTAGFEKRKFKLAMASLRDATNQLVERLAKAPFANQPAE